MEFEPPPGFVLVPRGGRPPKHGKHIAVALARHMLSERLGTLRLADEAICEAFDIGEASTVRQSVRKAVNGPLRNGFAFPVSDRVMVWVAGRFDRRAGTPVPDQSGVAWLWSEGMLEAVEARISSVKTTLSVHMQARPMGELTP